MSRAFVREDSPRDDELPERPVSSRPNYVTPGGMALLKAKVEELTKQRSATLLNSDDPEIRRKRHIIERDLVYFKARYETAILVDHNGKDFADIRFGAIADVKGASGKNRRFEIVGEDEADPDSGRINCASPLAQALLGKKAGEQAVCQTRDGRQELTVISVKYPPPAGTRL
ncbi:MAG: GreA/GreB family elongation factor [bacterium]